MASHTTSSIRAKTFEDNVFTLTITFRDGDGHEEESEVQLLNLYDATPEMLEWEWAYQWSSNVQVWDPVGAPIGTCYARPGNNSIIPGIRGVGRPISLIQGDRRFSME